MCSDGSAVPETVDPGPRSYLSRRQRGRAGSGRAGLARRLRGEPGSSGWGDRACSPASTSQNWLRCSLTGDKIAKSDSRSTPGGENRDGAPGCGVGPGAAAAESPNPEPHGLGAFPRLRTRGAGFSQPSRLSRLRCDAIPAGFTSVGSAGGLWKPWGAPGGLGSLGRGSGDATWCCPHPTCALCLAKQPRGDLPRGRAGSGLASELSTRPKVSPSAPAWPHSPPSLCNLAQVPGGQAGGDGQSRTHTRTGGKSREKKSLPTPRE